MSRQEQIERIDKLVIEWEDMVGQKGTRNCVSLTEHLVDAGIGDKDRFECAISNRKREVKPIDYKETDE